MQATSQHLIAANRILYGNPKKFLKLYRLLGSVFDLTKITSEILKACRIEKATYQNMLQQLEHTHTQATLTWLKDPNHHLIEFNDRRYPDLLKQIADPPPVLFAIGNADLLTTPQIAVVGSRRPTPYGHRQVNFLVKDLALLNLTITSGLACGIDTFAHQCTLQQHGNTIAVVGNGLDSIYPKSNQKLFHKIAAQGCIISEYPLGTAAVAAHFPQRNRLISGLSLGCLVIEARIKSGTLITARLALEQDREVFAVPGLIQQKESEGCHYLIKNGAKLVDHCADIIVELPPWLNLLHSDTIYKKSVADPKTELASQQLSEEAKKLLKQLKTTGAMTYEQCLSACELNVQSFAKAQLECELLDLISYAKGRYWLK